MMGSRMNEFREFVSLHPLLRDEVRNGKRTWQNIYEEWVLYGDGEKIWKKYTLENQSSNLEGNKTSKINGITDFIKSDGIKNTFEYIRKIDPNKVNNTLNNMQKIIQIVQTFTGNKGVTIPNSVNAFSDWWD